MDRLHVTKAYATPIQSKLHCMPRPATGNSTSFDPLSLAKPGALHLN
jgi:hypothetical protein